jgi:lysophospholipase L1-like esterase
MIVKEWLIRLTLITFGFIIPIVALEIGLSRFDPHKTYFAARPDKYIGWKGIPYGEEKFRFGSISVDIKMNSHGFRDIERNYEKEKDVFRIVVLGDSFTEALQVPLEQTFPYILEEKLNSEINKKYEVINLGISGFGTAQEYLTLKHYGLKYQPDFVILAFFIGNDFIDNSLTLSAGDPNPKPYFVLNNGKLEGIPFKIKEPRTKRGVIEDLWEKLFPNTYYLVYGKIAETPWLANFLWKIGIKNSTSALIDKSKKSESKTSEINTLWYDVYSEDYTPEWQEAWDVTKALILELKNELEMNKIRFLVVVIPDELEFRHDKWDEILDKNPQMRTLKYDLRKPENILSNFFDANKIGYLLLRPEFQKYSKETGKDLHFHYSYDHLHWNAKGHALTAELIYRKLKDDKLVPVK